MKGIKAMKIKLSAARQNLDKLPWLGFEWSPNEIVGVAKISTNDKNISPTDLEFIGEIIIDYLRDKTGYVEHGGSFAGPFIFSFKRQTDILCFMREMRVAMMLYGEFRHIALEFKLQ
ncbi:hypothetical protein [Methylobacterium sp. WL18]|uniref:hypothetical protein n=1 Tax=Methylobacterium sp. WL18 TaxID=2603897 RepID=UPI00164F54D5|nr:hypothetical protein [Methylobacterium sp. WL18]